MKSCMDEEPGASVRKSRANAGHVGGRQRERDFALEANTGLSRVCCAVVYKRTSASTDYPESRDQR